MKEARAAGAVLYARVSDPKQDSDGHNLPTQQKKLTNYCHAHGLQVLKLFVEKDSARTTDRPSFQEMIAYCRKHRGTVSHVIVADLSRLARNVADQGVTIATLKQLGVTLISVDEPQIDSSAAGRLAANMLGAFAQFFSDSLSERTRYRMAAAVKAGRFPWPAPLGYDNVAKALQVDRERAPLIRKAFELIGSGTYTTGDAVLKLVTGLGLTTKKGRPLSKQSFARLLSNPIYAGWVVSGEVRTRGNHEPLISNELFETVQNRLNGKSSPHKAVNPDFPLRGFVRCAKCNRPLTAGWAKGRTERYAHYWCWTKNCRAVNISRDKLEQEWISLLASMAPGDELLAALPEIAAREWSARKERIATDTRILSTRMSDQAALNQRSLIAKINGEISQEDFDTVKSSTAAEIEKIKEQITALESERSTLQELSQQASTQLLDLVTAWRTANVNQKQELANGLFEGGLVSSLKRGFFEPANVAVTDLFRGFMESIVNGTYVDQYDGVPDGI